MHGLFYLLTYLYILYCRWHSTR